MSAAGDRTGGVPPVVVVGAGLAGVACARALDAAGVPLRLLDRGHRVGGRMASRRVEDRPVDLGASYLTVGDDDFRAVVHDWRARGLAAPWTDTFTVLEAGSAPSSKGGPMRWGAPGGLRGLVEDLADGLDVEPRQVETVHSTPGPDAVLLVDATPASAVVLAMPDPQAARLLGAGLDPVLERLDREFDPVIALAAWWPERTWDAVDPGGRFHGAFVNNDDDVAWIADDGRRRGDDAPVLVAHSTVDFARRHLDGPAGAGPPLVTALRRLLDLDDPLATHVHRWSLARPTGERADPFLLQDVAGGLVGVCGDGWGPSPKVETAWRSGHELGRELAARLG